MHNLNVDGLTIDGLDLSLAGVNQCSNGYYWFAECLIGLMYSSKLEEKFFDKPENAIIDFTKRCFKQNLRGAKHNGN